ncbi:hypothetical protein NTE_03428 [Candidatus Nitrososphaera evergladensis SR1]|uniref:Uncharacterized protein n=1 Tax=Candidatus Nitrososphaera evergladensis SR1 TaxID=1459636 RepID=A0A075MUW9_9ARCH|nr:hypothetical protein [Candidatus Nitrososphaera evergladensis]AIF85456.1 hypothetical protein NTE_03428 [Candidatus Nitrososphaera evergladensis SR1]
MGIGIPPIVGLLSGAKCNPVTDYPKINGMSAAVTDWECKNNDQVSLSFKQKTIGLQTDKHTIVFLYMSSAPVYYDKHLTEFNRSIETLKIPDTIGPPSTPEFSSGTMLGVTTAATIGFIAFFLPCRSGLIKG